MYRMFSLTITERAADAIRKEVALSSIKKPAVYLVESRDGVPSAQELDEIGVSNDVRRAMEHLSTKSPNVVTAPWRLVPYIYPRMHFWGLFQVEVSGILFLFPPELKRKANGGTLDLGQKTLLLLDRAGRVVLPRQDLLSSWKKPASETPDNSDQKGDRKKWSWVVGVTLLILLAFIWFMNRS
jgi:hypothetical protein